MRTTWAAACLAALLAAGVGAQTSETTSRTKIEVKEGKTVTVTGCLRSGASDAYTLTDVTGPEGTMNSYQLVGSDGKDLSKHVGHRVQITGKAVDQEHGKIETETKTETKDAGGEPRETEAKTKIKGDLKGLPFLGVKSVKMIATVCP